METIYLAAGDVRPVRDANFVARRPDAFPRLSTFSPPRHFLYYQREGLRVMEDVEEPFEMRAGDVVLFFRGNRYPSHRPATPYRAMNILFEPSTADRVVTGRPAARPGDGEIALASRVSTGRDPMMRQLFEDIVLLSHSTSALKRHKAAALLRALLLELAIRSSPERRTGDGRVEYAIDIIERSLDRRVDVDDLARQVGMTRRTLTRQFRQTTGSSIAQFQLDARLRLAASILDTSPDITLREVSDTLGFYDEFHLSRSFKKRFGRSPRQHRRRPRSTRGAKRRRSQ